MSKRPRSVTVIGWVFIGFGAIALLASLLPSVEAPAGQRMAEYKRPHPFEEALTYISRVLAVVCGVFVLRGSNWARWLLVVWVGFHVIVGAWHSPWSLLVHGLLFAGVVYILFCRQAAAYFRSTRPGPP